MRTGSSPRRVAWLAMVSASLVLSSCDGGFFADPAPAFPAGLAISYDFAGAASAAATLGEAYDKLDRARVQIVLAGGGVVLDSVFVFEPGGEETTVRIELELESDEADADVSIELRSASRPVFTGQVRTRLVMGELARANVELTPVALEVVLPVNVGIIDALGDNLPIVAGVVLATGDTVQGLPMTWLSSNPQVLTVSSTGIVTSRAEGSARITASYQGFSDDVVVTVAARVVQVTVEPASIRVLVSGTVQFVAIPLDRNGNTLVRPASWSSADQTIATVNTAGLVSGVALGTTTITAESEGQTGSGEARVVLSLDPIAPSLSNLTAFQDGDVNGCTNCTDVPVTTFDVVFEYADDDGGIGLEGTLVEIAFAFTDGGQGSFDGTPTTTFNGSQFSGTATSKMWFRFSGNAWVDVIVRMAGAGDVDAFGNPILSDPVSVRIQAPAGAN